MQNKTNVQCFRFQPLRGKKMLFCNSIYQRQQKSRRTKTADSTRREHGLVRPDDSCNCLPTNSPPLATGHTAMINKWHGDVCCGRMSTHAFVHSVSPRLPLWDLAMASSVLVVERSPGLYPVGWCSQALTQLSKHLLNPFLRTR